MSLDSPAHPASSPSRYTPGGERYDIAEPVRAAIPSLDAGWASLLVRVLDIPTVVEPIDFPINHDQMIAVCTDGECEVESFGNGAWRRGYYRPGVSGITPPHKTDRLRFRAITKRTSRFLQICIPPSFFAVAQDQLSSHGSRFTEDQPLNALCVDDGLLLHTAIALQTAMAARVPNLYAEAAAQFLATHLLTKQHGWKSAKAPVDNSEILSDRRLNRVLEFIEHRLGENLSLAQLSSEAGISQFHFIKAFKRASGTTPYQYLVGARMRLAAKLLRESDLGLKQVATKCGYESSESFGVAFRRHFGKSPGNYRRMMPSNE